MILSWPTITQVAPDFESVAQLRASLKNVNSVLGDPWQIQKMHWEKTLELLH